MGLDDETVKFVTFRGHLYRIQVLQTLFFQKIK